MTDMSGPIVRTGTTPEYWKNWDSIFGAKKGKGPAKAAVKPAKSKPAKKSARPAKKK
jgi:hypothetical protein